MTDETNGSGAGERHIHGPEKACQIGCPAYPTRRVRDLIERSSLGAPEAKAARESVSDETAGRIVALARELDAATPDADETSGFASILNTSPAHVRNVDTTPDAADASTGASES